MLLHSSLYGDPDRRLGSRARIASIRARQSASDTLINPEILFIRLGGQPNFCRHDDHGKWAIVALLSRRLSNAITARKTAALCHFSARKEMGPAINAFGFGSTLAAGGSSNR